MTEEETKPPTEDANNINAMKSFQEIFELCKISQMESKLQMLIDDKLGQKIEVLPKFSERMEEQHQASDYAKHGSNELL